TRLRVRPGDDVADWQALNPAEMISNTDHVLVQSSDGGPSLLLPTFNFPIDQTLLFSTDITFPADTAMQLFYKNEAGQDYSADRVHTVAVKAGRQQIVFELPVRKLDGRLRLDLGAEAGDYLIHSMEIRVAPR